jgi:hypothetical protein
LRASSLTTAEDVSFLSGWISLVNDGICCETNQREESGCATGTTAGPGNCHAGGLWHYVSGRQLAVVKHLLRLSLGHTWLSARGSFPRNPAKKMPTIGWMHPAIRDVTAAASSFAPTIASWSRARPARQVVAPFGQETMVGLSAARHKIPNLGVGTCSSVASAVIGRQASDLGQTVEADVVFEMGVDVVDTAGSVGSHRRIAPEVDPGPLPNSAAGANLAWIDVASLSAVAAGSEPSGGDVIDRERRRRSTERPERVRANWVGREKSHPGDQRCKLEFAVQQAREHRQGRGRRCRPV